MAMATDSSDSSSESSSSANSLVLSYESSSFGSKDEGVPEGIHPFSYEPLISSSDHGESTSSDSSEDISPRLLNLNW